MTTNALVIHGLELCVCLGWRENERLKKQIVLLDIHIYFPKLPDACITDKLEDTLCYSTLAHEIREQTNNKNYHLIEHLCHEIYKLVKILAAQPIHVTVGITKYPDIQGLTSGVSFHYGDKVT